MLVGAVVAVLVSGPRVRVRALPPTTRAHTHPTDVNQDTIPPWLRWIEYLSHLYFAFMGLAINDFQGRTGWSCGSTPDTNSSSSNSGCMTTGDEILDRLGFGGNHLWEAFLGLIALTVAYNGEREWAGGRLLGYACALRVVVGACLLGCGHLQGNCLRWPQAYVRAHMHVVARCSPRPSARARAALGYVLLRFTRPKYLPLVTNSKKSK